MLVTGSVDWATYDGHRYPLSTHEYADDTIDPRGYRHVQSFKLDGSVPVLTFAFGIASSKSGVDGARCKHEARHLSDAARQPAI